ncbi:uncharacterized protein FRV6_00356 [Fusarium oxysporum]|jgi:clusterin-associated protein 1
MGNI